MVKVVFGTMTFGKKGEEQSRVHTLEECQAILDVFKKHGHVELDSARMYGGGTSEEFLRDMKVEEQGFKVATKNFPSARYLNMGIKWNAGIYDHTTDGIHRSVDDSLKALGTKKIDLYYLHAPDRQVPFEETIAQLKKEYDAGKFERWGVSNYTAKEVEQIVQICKDQGFVTPAVYQGIYNAICRTAEPELIPVLRKHNIAFYIFNPLGGGFLTGNIKREHEEEGRFDPKTGQGAMYRKRYFREPLFEAVDIVTAAASKENIPIAQAALRWLQHHSVLKEEHGDAIIIGASSLKHIDQNLIDLEQPALPPSVVEAFDKAYKTVLDGGAAPPYHH